MSRPTTVSLRHAEALIEARQAAWWNKDHKLLLISPALLAETPKGAVLRCIDDSTATVGTDEIDTDTRFGMIAYGFEIADVGDPEERRG